MGSCHKRLGNLYRLGSGVDGQEDAVVGETDVRGRGPWVELHGIALAGVGNGYGPQMALHTLTAEELENVVVAYEPVWAIGTGLTATDEQANETIGVIRAAIARKYGKRTANAVRIQYGGSMNPKNVKGLMAQPEIDGGLIGGASLKAPDFSQVVNYDK